ncbi:phosphatase PAP2 family protein [Candidatus Gracilibacteria bacterium]|nr:phosphatase PAP2 family protein [Candidatus Gracilibacteria bacterium]MCF7898432.1 phosphatase PAP2 family protein [Candidatus Paceibacterota bacterium]
MNQIIIFSAEYFIFISALYVFVHMILMRKNKNYLQQIIIIFGSAVFAWVIAHVLKGIVAHPRPGLVNALIVPDSTYSFPSGHATFMSTLAFVTYSFDKRAGIVVASFAVITGVARVISGVHYWYDIIGGFVVGALISYMVMLSYKYLFKK